MHHSYVGMISSPESLIGVQSLKQAGNRKVCDQINVGAIEQQIELPYFHEGPRFFANLREGEANEKV